MPIQSPPASQLAADYRRQLRPGRNGALATTFRHDLVSARVDGGQAAQVITVTVDEANEKTYALGVLGVAVTFDAESGDSGAEIAEGLAAAVNAEPLLGQRVVAEAYSDTVILTAKFPGLDLDVDDSDADLTAATTSAGGAGSPIPFASVVVLEPVDRPADGAGEYAAWEARLPGTGDVTESEFDDDLILAVAVARHDAEVDREGNGAYDPGDIAECGRSCDFFISGAPDAAPAGILVGTEGEERGKIFFDAGDDRVPLPGARWAGHKGEGVAVIEFRG